MENIRLNVSDFLALTNQTLEYAYPSIEIEGEIQSFKVNQNKYVFFDLKDAQASVNCFMMVWQLRMPLEDGMKVVVTAAPKITNWGKFSLTVRQITPVGEGSLKRSFDLLLQKLKTEGLFDEERKRMLPKLPQYIGVISSKDAAGYADFIKILSERWGGMKVEVAHVQVQGSVAPEQMTRAITYFNQLATPPEVIVMIRGGGSADDLAVFNDEPLVRAVVGSRVPVLTGIGHEVDTTLVDMVADKRAATPSNAAQLLTPDKREIITYLHSETTRSLLRVETAIGDNEVAIKGGLQRAIVHIDHALARMSDRVTLLGQTLSELNPEKVLQRGYAIVRNAQGGVVEATVSKGDAITIETKTVIIYAGVDNVRKK